VEDDGSHLRTGDRLEVVMARDGIRDLVARYNSYSDSGLFDPLFGLFVPDASMEITDVSGKRVVYDGISEIKRIFTGAQERIRGRPDAGATGYIRHFTSTHQIDMTSSLAARGRLYFAVLMSHGLDHWGRYLDEYVRVDGWWRFAHRRVFLDGCVPASWFAATSDAEG
jgi:hypothetical protein